MSYTYPGNREPSLKDVNFNLESGESLAIVGYNGSGAHRHSTPFEQANLLNWFVAVGKSTLAKVLLRIVDFETGNLFVNGIDIRRYDPVEYHRHITTVFQGFSKFNSTVKENIGVGYVQKMGSRAAIDKAVNLAGAETIIGSLPNGLRTKLDTSGFSSTTFPPFSNNTGSLKTSRVHHGLSGGEVCQRQASVTDNIVLMAAGYSGNGLQYPVLSCEQISQKSTSYCLMSL